MTSECYFWLSDHIRARLNWILKHQLSDKAAILKRGMGGLPLRCRAGTSHPAQASCPSQLGWWRCLCPDSQRPVYRGKSCVSLISYWATNCPNDEEGNGTEGHYNSYERIALKLLSSVDFLGVGFQTTSTTMQKCNWDSKQNIVRLISFSPLYLEKL